MNRILPLTFIAILYFSGFPGISQAQNDISKGEMGDVEKIDEAGKPGELSDIDRLEQNVSNMLKMLEELEKNEGLKEKLKVGGEKKNKPPLPDPMDQFINPNKKLSQAPPSQNKNYTRKNKTEKRSRATDEVVKFVPEGPGSHFRQGLDFWKSKQLDEAIKHFKEVVRLDHENAHAYWNLGLIYEEKKDDLQAIDNMKKAETIYLKYKYPLYAQQARRHVEKLSRKKNTSPESALLSN